MSNEKWMQKTLERAAGWEARVGDGNNECFRLVDRDVADIVVDRYGPCLWVSWLWPQPPTEDELSFIGQLASNAECDHWMVNGMVNRGKDPGLARRWQSPSFPDRWQAREEGMTFLLRADRGLSPGLFLDQRANRRYLGRHCRGARVLNLFAYTCSFSVAAALGGAAAVTSVDVSPGFLDWGKENFAANGLSTTGHIFTKADARDYLALARKRGWLFDTIILDPPSFSRSKGKTFSVRSELIPMALNCLDLLAPSGEVLVCTNLSTWPMEELRYELKEATDCKLRPGERDSDITDEVNAAKTLWVKKAGSSLGFPPLP
jgi:23S rRNA (cytosine1962-C5)-methyltransferase